MSLLPLALLGGGAAIIYYVSKHGKGSSGEISVYTTTAGQKISIPFNQLISVPGVGPATQQALGEGLTIRWLGFVTQPTAFTKEQAQVLEFDLASAGAWYEAAYLSEAINQIYQ